MANRPISLVPTDPLFGQQWHLLNTGQIQGAMAGFDINVVKVWPDYTGAGVLVAAVDDGFDQTHPDLVTNDRADLSWDLVLNQPGAEPVATDDDHGTSVGGLVVAEANNGIGGTGVAWDAGLIGYRGLVDDLSEQASLFRDAATRMLQAGAAISTNSWGAMVAPFDGQSVQTSYLATMRDLVAQGRDGHGVIALFASGNDRQTRLNTNYDPTDNMPYAIAVAASKADGFVTGYSTPGASVLVTAPGSDPESIVTTDRQGLAGYNTLPGVEGNYTDTPDSYFRGTSAATPIAAGVVALMLQANPRLGYRDVQEILVYSSRRAVFLDNEDTTPGMVNGAVNWNGGGLYTGDDFGFGNIDAHAAVRLAESWQKTSTLGNLSVVESSTETPSLQVAAGSQGQVRAEFVDGLRAEQVTVAIDLQTERLQDVTLVLVSPGGTRSLLIDSPPVLNDEQGNPIALPERLVYTLNTVRSWGESLEGAWILELSNAATGAPVTLQRWSLTAYAADAAEPQSQIFTDELLSFANLEASRLNIRPQNGVDLNAAAVTSDVVLDLSGEASRLGAVAISLEDTASFRHLFAGDGNDRLVGNTLDNELMGGRGNNAIDGGAGRDTALYIGGRSGYSVQQTGESYEVVSRVLAGGGTDALSNIEAFRFGSTSLLAKSALDQTQTFGSFYDAMFNRGADGQGLRFWTDAYFDDGATEVDVALGFTSASEDGVANLTTDQFVTRLYEYGLERTPDAAGFAFWSSALQTQAANRGQVLLGFVHSEEFITNRLDLVSVQVAQLGDIWA